jgi:hypothetical protein
VLVDGDSKLKLVKISNMELVGDGMGAVRANDLAELNLRRPGSP